MYIYTLNPILTFKCHISTSWCSHVFFSFLSFFFFGHAMNLEQFIAAKDSSGTSSRKREKQAVFEGCIQDPLNWDSLRTALWRNCASRCALCRMLPLNWDTATVSPSAPLLTSPNDPPSVVLPRSRRVSQSVVWPPEGLSLRHHPTGHCPTSWPPRSPSNLHSLSLHYVWCPPWATLCFLPCLLSPVGMFWFSYFFTLFSLWQFRFSGLMSSLYSAFGKIKLAFCLLWGSVSRQSQLCTDPHYWSSPMWSG